MKRWLILLLAVCLIFALAACNRGADEPQPAEEAAAEPEPEPEPEPVYNPLTGLEVEREIEARIFAVSIDNHPAARPQSGVSQADIIYEIPAEGNIPRLVALFYGSQPENIGPVRSARPYAIDIARGWGALWVHCGASPEAYRYLSGPAVVSLDEIAYERYFWRDYSRHKGEHTLYTGSSKLYEYLEYREKPLVQEDVSFLPFRYGEEQPQGAAADWISFKYADTEDIYLYNAATGLYARYIGEEPYIDADTGEQIMVANIIMQRVVSKVTDNKGRLAIDMTAGGQALLFTGGKAISGSWSRDSLDDNTQYYDLEGNPFVLAPGQTWIQLMDSNVKMQYIDTTAEPVEM